ncbi:hypothetical protein MKW98_032660 [Papaver atlanticum]|uniref:Kinesin motor domain-containing protein n=1 Tax=Papaver atlanticum TaxID=357466 RepID=A0AAD4XL62_9MAGN|nr:hypothetical protein MKW98_032660 [Papaver atlanticum]
MRISEAATALKSRFGFHEPSSDTDLIKSSPFLKSSFKENNLVYSTPSSSSVSNFGERDDHVGVIQRSSSLNFELQEDPSFWKDHNVQVVIRIRPLSNSEISIQGLNKCVRQESNQTITWTGHPESRYTFDLVADENVTQENLFNVAGLPMVENCMGGYNSCMFAYGQTGSGKTHTMMGDIDGGTRRHSVNCGMTPRVFEHLFTRIQKDKEARRDEKLRFTCKCSFLEIYNEQILDLLDPSSANLQIREDSKKGVYVENLKEMEVTCARDVIQLLVQGTTNRKVAATNMNHASSRSHSVFTCIIESKWEVQGVTHHRFARLNLVDLAGSERQKSSGAEGERLKEATNINKSLSTLGLVIMNLVNISNGKSLHVPYRDSKLTFLLQDSLGGNSKTTIIANISPANCNSLETLGTLKFAQRAKFIKNNAIVNEDASGDVLTMRIQIQQLKKEVNQLRSLVNGGIENQEVDFPSVSFPGSPGSFKWEGLQGSFSPLTCDRKKPRNKEFEAALVVAFRREKEKQIAMQSLAAENQAAMQLAKRREDEIKNLKMRLRFREAGIKRLEAVASGKISAEVHLLQEKEEYLKEIEVLHNQVDRNLEVTRFAMENLRLKEEVRRLKSFSEEGEREMMSEQIMILQNKLLEALDWKLMHESESSMNQKGNSSLASFEDSLLTSSQDPASSWGSSMSAENEFLRIQAIQNQSEVETLHKKLDSCLKEKENLQSQIDDLVRDLENEKRRASNMEEEARKNLPVGASDDQMELKTMVDAISAASEREAEAHETAIILAKENDELRMKLKVFIEDNRKLIELYDGAVSEVNKAEKTEDNSIRLADIQKEKDTDSKMTIDNLKHQLQDLHEENEKLMSLYEKAMLERDEFKSRQSNVKVKEECSYSENLDGDQSLKLTGLASQPGEEKDSGNELNVSGSIEESLGVGGDLMEVEENVFDGAEPKMSATETSEEMGMTSLKLETAQRKLVSAAKALSLFALLEKATTEEEKLSKETEAAEKCILVKQQDLTDSKLLSSEIQDKKAIAYHKLLALKSSLSSISLALSNWEEREERARRKLELSSTCVVQKKEELACLQAKKDEVEVAQERAHQSEDELRNKLICLKSKLEEENKKVEAERVLFAIDSNVVVPAQRNWNLGGKATELLISEELQTKLKREIKQTRENLNCMVMEIDELKIKSEKLETDIETVRKDLSAGLKSVEELELGFQELFQEKEVISESRETMMNEIGNMVVEYQQCVFESDLKEGELELLGEELQMEMNNLKELRKMQEIETQKMAQLLNETRISVSEATSLLSEVDM